MPLGSFISTKWRGTGLPAGVLVTTIIFLTGSTCFAGIPASGEAALVRKALDQVYRMDYGAAEETLTQGLPPESPARPYFAGLVCMNRFADWGDTIALRRAEGYWENLSPRAEPSKTYRKTDPADLQLYRGLAGVQLSYAATLRGQRLRAAALALASNGLLDDLKAPEARATRMLYVYYRSRLLEKLPFVGEPELDVPAFRAAVAEAPALREMFQGSLFWIHMDAARYPEAQAIAAEFLDRFPENRLMRQMRADALFRSGKTAEARAAYEKLREEYAALPTVPGRLPLGYYRCVGNLARIQAAAGDRRGAQARREEWNRAEALGLMPWLPPLLRRDLARP